MLVQENRSLNHTLGWYGAENRSFDGRQKGAYRDLRQGADGPLVSTAAASAIGCSPLVAC